MCRPPTGALFTHDRYHRVFRVISVLIHDEDAAQDLTEELFEAVLKGLHRYDPHRASFDAWINGFIPIVVHRHRTRTARRLAHEGDDLDGVTAPDRFGVAERLGDIAAALRRLSRGDRELIARSAVLGQTTDEIAAATGRTRTGTTTALSRARRRLETFLGPDAA